MNIENRIKKLEQSAAPRGRIHYPSLDEMLDEAEAQADTPEGRERAEQARYAKPFKLNLYGQQVGIDELIGILETEAAKPAAEPVDVSFIGEPAEVLE